MPISTQTPSLILDFENVRVALCLRLAAIIIIIYDHLITLDRETTFIWAGEWTFVKILFLANRYWVLSGAMFCIYGLFAPSVTDSLYGSGFFYWQGWQGVIASMLAEAILQLRLYALYSGKKKILCLMVTFYVVCSATSAWIMQNRLALISETASIPIPYGRFCAANHVPPRLYTFWIPILAFETLLFVLAIARGVEESLANDDHGSLLHRGQRLFDLLIRDSVMYFLVIGLVYLGCLIFWIMDPNILWEAPIGFSVAFSCTLGSRMILNIREAGDLQARSCSQQSALPISAPRSAL